MFRSITMAECIIETGSLRKSYGSKTAVADLTLQVPRGEVFGFLGPNGAGKSTSVKMLLGLVRPSAGMAKVLGQAPGHPPTMGRIGFLPEHFRFHEWLHADELLDFHGQLYDMPTALRRHRVSEVLALVGLSEHAHRPLSDFSKGMLQRIGLAQALLPEPELVFLDEPTSALDPFGRMLVRTIIHDLKARGTTVFLNSHLLGEVEATCDRVSFIKDGRVLRTLALCDLESGLLRVEVRVDRVTPTLLAALDTVASERRIVDAPPEGSAVQSLGDESQSGTTTLELLLPDEECVPTLAERIYASGSRLYALTPKRVSLEQVFLDVVGREDSGQ